MAGLLQIALEEFNGMKITILLIRPMPVIAFKEKDAMKLEWAKELINVNHLQEALENVHTEVESGI